jgi:hypothetical protein
LASPDCPADEAGSGPPKAIDPLPDTGPPFPVCIIAQNG